MLTPTASSQSVPPDATGARAGAGAGAITACGVLPGPKLYSAHATRIPAIVLPPATRRRPATVMIAPCADLPPTRARGHAALLETSGATMWRNNAPTRAPLRSEEH